MGDVPESGDAPAFAWVDGGLVAADDAQVPVYDRGFQYGDGVFETIRAEAGKVFFLEDHLTRLAAGLAVLGIDLPEASARAREGLAAVLGGLGREPATLKVIATRGIGPAGPGWVARTRDFRASLVVTGRADPAPRPGSLRAITASVVRNERSPLARVKSLNYAEMVLARAEAERAGVDEGIVLNTQGRVAEASAANVFAVREGRIVTPPVEEGCLPGIVRAQVIDLARELSLDFAEETITPDALAGADEAFVTNSRIGVVPLVELDGEPMGTGKPGYTTGSVRSALRAAELAFSRSP